MNRGQWIGVVVAGLLSLGLAVLLYARFGDPDVQVAVRTYDIVSDTRVDVEFSVRKDPEATVVCTVRARGEDGGEVGNALVRVGPSDEGSVLLTHELPTIARAATGEVTGCTPL